MIGDIDADGQLEFVVGTGNGSGVIPNLYAFNLDTSTVNGWPLSGEDIYTSAAADDIDNDSMLEIGLGSWHDYKMHCWELGENTFNPELLPWPKFHHDLRNTGLYVQLLCGDVTGDGVIDIGDVFYLINYLFRSGPAPDPLWIGNVNGDEVVDIGDVVYLINYLFKDGPPPRTIAINP